ncbi:MAG: XdhC family protein [Acidobacteria bacterium]|nr:MAG: XdhC family protein [Acidobacteriota bacterium]REK06240.1 MAG: XdhC family protein [Acidobacteriota bacterium]
MHDILQEIDRWRGEGRRVALATVIRTAGSTPRPLGSRMAISDDGQMAGSVSGGCIEGAVFEEAREVLENGVPKRLDYGISDEQAWSVGLSCGGTLEVLIERLEPEGAAAPPASDPEST